MSNFNRCPKCNQYDWLDSHKCYPFKVYYPEYYSDEWETVYGKSAENVVERIAARLNDDDPVFDENIFESPITIMDSEGNKTSFKCHASFSIDYYPEEIDTPPDLPKETPNEN